MKVAPATVPDAVPPRLWLVVNVPVTWVPDCESVNTAVNAGPAFGAMSASQVPETFRIVGDVGLLPPPHPRSRPRPRQRTKKQHLFIASSLLIRFAAKFAASLLSCVGAPSQGDDPFNRTCSDGVRFQLHL